MWQKREKKHKAKKVRFYAKLNLVLLGPPRAQAQLQVQKMIQLICAESLCFESVLILRTLALFGGGGGQEVRIVPGIQELGKPGTALTN